MQLNGLLGSLRETVTYRTMLRALRSDDDEAIGRNARHFLTPDLDVRHRRKTGGDLSGEHIAVHRQRMATRHPRRLRGFHRE